MSVEQYQRTLNSLDKDIADLEKRKLRWIKRLLRSREKPRTSLSVKMHPQQQLEVN